MSQRSHSSPFNKQQLQRCEEEITELKYLLKDRRLRRELLRKQQLHHRASSSQTSPIRRLPEEILVMVFFEVAEASTMALGRLLFVCQTWYQFLTGHCPTLWSRIEYWPEGGTKEIETFTQHITSALRFSTTAPLDITIHLDGIGAPWFWREVALKVAQPHIGDTESDITKTRYDQIMSWAHTEGWHSTFPLLLDYTDALDRGLQSLVGKDGEVMRRWRSLSLSWDPLACAAIWVEPLDFLRHPLPLLKRLTLVTFEQDSPYDPKISFPDIPHLTNLSWDASSLLFFSTPSTSHVTTLNISDVSPFCDLVQATKFPNIDTLVVQFPRHNQVTILDNGPFQYPNLMKLTISGCIPPSFLNGFDAPRLETLRLFYSFEEGIRTIIDSSAHIPRLSSLLLQTCLMRDVTAVCKNLITRFEGIQRVDLSHHREEILAAHLREMRSSGFPDVHGYIHHHQEWEESALYELLVD